jgi:pimeloyl-ACP methyl ester carboxylesterase
MVQERRHPRIMREPGGSAPARRLGLVPVESQREQSGDPPCIVVHLVHGTFARRAKWTQEGSELRRHLDEVLPGTIDFERLEWSARNRSPDRQDAARRLADRIEQRASSEPEPLQFIVGHSHGGNVALYALERQSTERAVSGVVCFNTPFVATLRRNTQHLFWTVGYLAAFVVLASVVSGLSAARERWGDLVVLPGAVLASAAILGAIVFITRVTMGTESWLQRKREETIQSVALPEAGRVPVLCLWGAGDEVQGVLGLLDALANLPFLLLHVFSVTVLFVIVWILHFTGSLDRFITLEIPPTTADWWPVLVWIDDALRDALENAFSAVSYVALVVLGLVAVAVVLNLLLRLIPVGLPVSSFVSSLFVRVTFTAVPLPVRNAEYRDAALPFSVLQHSSAYRNPIMHEAVSDWMIGIMQQRGTIP